MLCFAMSAGFLRRSPASVIWKSDSPRIIALDEMNTMMKVACAWSAAIGSNKI